MGEKPIICSGDEFVDISGSLQQGVTASPGICQGKGRMILRRFCWRRYIPALPWKASTANQATAPTRTRQFTSLTQFSLSMRPG